LCKCTRYMWGRPGRLQACRGPPAPGQAQDTTGRRAPRRRAASLAVTDPEQACIRRARPSPGRRRAAGRPQPQRADPRRARPAGMHFPDAALRAVAAQLLAAPDAPAALAALVAACGVSRHWRDVCRYVGGAAVLHFDSLERCTRGRIGRALAPREARFRQARAPATRATEWVLGGVPVSTAAPGAGTVIGAGVSVDNGRTCLRNATLCCLYIHLIVMACRRPRRPRRRSSRRPPGCCAATGAWSARARA